jgi:protein-tyrosine phosphatase
MAGIEDIARIYDLEPSERSHSTCSPIVGLSVILRRYLVPVHTRRLEFEGVENFRDLGGYPTADGGHTVWGQIFRSDSLHKLTPSDLVAFERMGVRMVYDLRGDEERATHPNPFDSIQLAVVGQPRNGDRRTIDAAAFSAASDGEQLLRDLYIGMLLHSAPLFGVLLTGFVEPTNRPAVFHCHAGKDRTGIAAALLLLAVGVDRETILDDYELTRRYRTPDHQQDSLANLLALGMSPEAAAGVMTAPRWAMQDALDAIDSDFGGIDAYLTGPARMTPSSLRELRASFVTKPAG